MYAKFIEATELVHNTIGKNKNHPYYFELDALMSQALTGDINYKRPNRLTKFWIDTRKWDAWNALKGMTQELAMRKYISLATKVCNQTVMILLV